MGTGWGNTPLQEAQRFHRPRIVAILKKEMVRRGIIVPSISEEGSESETMVVTVNGGSVSNQSGDKNVKEVPSFTSFSSISINGSNYGETGEMAALTIQGA